MTCQSQILGNRNYQPQVRSGSKGEIAAVRSDVRFSPPIAVKSRASDDVPSVPHRDIDALFNHLIGGG